MIDRRSHDGLALIAVLVVLSILLALLMPFLISMGHGDQSARHAIAEKTVELDSASVRDFMLSQVAKSNYAEDANPLVDGLDEFPDHLTLPEKFAEALGDRGQTLIAGEVTDLQRRIDIKTASPLVLANLLGLSGRLRGEHDADTTELIVEGADRFPDSGLLIVSHDGSGDREIVGYGSRSGDRFGDLQRGLFKDLGFLGASEEALADGSLVMDFRVVMAVIYPFFGYGDSSRYVPYEDVRDVQRIRELGFEGFSVAEMDILLAHCAVGGLREEAAQWGKPERVFSIAADSQKQNRILHVRSAAALGGGSLVRIRSRDGSAQEYGLVWTARRRGVPGDVLLESHWYLHLLTPLKHDFVAMETVVEPLVPLPVNVNTAARNVISALFANLRRIPRAIATGGGSETSASQPYVSPSQADEFAGKIVETRIFPESEAGVFAGELGPFSGWEDFHLRFFRPQLEQASNQQRTSMLRMLYENCLIGRPAGCDMGTMPLAFHSAPLIAYRAAALRRRAGGQEDARMERWGVAYVAPERQLHRGAATQEMLEESTRLDRHSPYWITHPINTSAVSNLSRGTIPPLRTDAHTLADAYPEMGFGQRRFPLRDGDAGALGPMPASTPLGWSLIDRELAVEETFANSRHPEGWDMAQEGSYAIRNNGPRASGTGLPNDQGQSRISARLTEGDGLTARHAVSMWFRLEDLDSQAIYDLAAQQDSLPERNRISLVIRDQKLVFEVFDEAGLDPNPLERDTSPERSSGIWEIPLAGMPISPGGWYHVSLSAMGNRPSQLTLLVDNVPRGEPQGRTHLTRAIEPFDRNRSVLRDRDDRGRFIAVHVDDTEGFPNKGVLRIGLELFEYVSKDVQTFFCEFKDSVGGRSARTLQSEFRVAIPPDSEGKDRQELLDILNRDDQRVVTPDHPIGSAVELYGYTVPVYPVTSLQVGSAELSSEVGPFAVARVANNTGSGLAPISVTFEDPGGVIQDPIVLGDGLDENNAVDLELGDPVSADLPAPSARKEVLATFAPSGGYALLVQRRMRFEPPLGVVGISTEVGGVEVIRYSARRGSRLTGITRNARLPGVLITGDAEGFFQPAMPRKFVTDWTIRFGDVQGDINLLPLYSTYVVPISIGFNGPIASVQDLVQWVQLYPGDGREEDTEWVRYNLVVANRFLVRAEQRAWDRLRFALTQQSRIDALQVSNTNGDSINGAPSDANKTPWAIPPHDGEGSIGDRDAIEYDLPAIAVARAALGFRGDRGTSSHAHDAGTKILPVHRFEFAWGSYGVSAARTGRNDRVAMVQGSRRAAGGVPDVEWHSVNWSSRVYGSDRVNPDGTGERPRGLERSGDWPFQLVAFRDEVRSVFFGEAEPSYELHTDSRLLDRLVKYPSGELPAADVDEAIVGGSAHGDLRAMNGLIDELKVVSRFVTPRPLDGILGENGREFFVRADVVLTPNGAMVGVQPDQWMDYGRRADFPPDGGLVMIDGEILAYGNFRQRNGRFMVAQRGRGLLGTEARSHDEGATVYFLEQVPAAILASGATVSDHRLVLEDLGGLPPFSGTVLMGRELLHYTWTRAEALEMPTWRDPTQDSSSPMGLFRGRYGTDANPATAGSPVIHFPIRYWDRYRPRAEDPEMSAMRMTFQQGPAWFDGFAWEEEDADELVDLQCLVRIDGYGSFADDPDQVEGMHRFVDASLAGKFHPLSRYGSSFEASFVTVYHPGCFDANTFLAQAWKKGPIVKGWVLNYEGETRILREKITVR